MGLSLIRYHNGHQAQGEAVAYPVSHSQDHTKSALSPNRPCPRPALAGAAGGRGALLPDDPPAVQELMNDLDGFTLLEGHLVLQ